MRVCVYACVCTRVCVCINSVKCINLPSQLKANCNTILILLTE